MRRSETGETLLLFESNFMRSVNPMMILQLLRERTMYIYELSGELSRRCGSRYSALPLYPIMRRLQDSGYVEETEQCIMDNRVRIYYGITDAGCEYLEQLKSRYRELLQQVETVAFPVPTKVKKAETPAEDKK